MLVDAVTT